MESSFGQSTGLKHIIKAVDCPEQRARQLRDSYLEILNHYTFSLIGIKESMGYCPIEVLLLQQRLLNLQCDHKFATIFVSFLPVPHQIKL